MNWSIYSMYDSDAQKLAVKTLLDKGGQISGRNITFTFPDGSEATADQEGNIKWVDKPRTTQQNKAMHKWFVLLAKKLNDAGLDQRKVLKPSIEISWTMDAVKEYLWRPIMIFVLKDENIESTKDLSTAQVDEVHKVLSKHLGEKFGIYVPWPSKKEQEK